VVTTAGDLLYATAADTVTRLGIGTAGQVLTVNSGATAPQWAAASASPASDTASVATAQSTTSTSYTDLSTSGPAVTLTTGTKVLVIVGAELYQNSVNDKCLMDYAVSGATTRSATDATCLLFRRGASDDVNIRASAASRITVTAGSNTFTAKYRSASGGTANFANRNIIVIDLGS